MKRIVVAVTGASGSQLAWEMLALLSSMEGVEVHLVMSDAARFTWGQESGRSLADFKAMANVVHEPSMIGASIASGSFYHDGMVVVPCSVKTLSAIAHCHSGDLISRAADVCLKEGRPLLLAVRETPFHLGHLRLMTSASENGAIIFPPIPAFYAEAESIEEQCRQLCGRILARIGLPNGAYPVWEGPS